VLGLIKETYGENKRVVFNGDGYSEEWHAEAEGRGLLNLKQTPDALPWLVDPQTVEVFERYKVLSERELEARYEVLVEQYATRINIEGEMAAELARTQLFPAAVQYVAMLDGAEGSRGVAAVRQEVVDLLDAFVDRMHDLERANIEHPADEAEPIEHARYVQSRVIPAMEGVREIADRLERIVPDRLWPLPKYSEMLFIK
jgi:glutamine synthetase